MLGEARGGWWLATYTGIVDQDIQSLLLSHKSLPGILYAPQTLEIQV